MKCAVFEIKQSSVINYYFTFRSAEQKLHIISGSFSDRAELEKSISCVRSTAPLAQVCSYNGNKGKPPYFEIQNQDSGVNFVLIGFQEEIIFSSINYENEELCRKAIDLLKENAKNAAIVDLTIDN